MIFNQIIKKNIMSGQPELIDYLVFTQSDKYNCR